MIRIGLTTVGLLLFVVAMACTKEVEVEVIKEVPVEVVKEVEVEKGVTQEVAGEDIK